MPRSPDDDDDFEFADPPEGDLGDKFKQSMEEDDDLDAPEPPDEPSGEGVSVTPEGDVVVPLSRREKRQERGKLLDEFRKTERENLELRERLARLEGRFDNASSQQPAQKQDEGPDEFEKRAIELQNEHRRRYEEMLALGNKATPQQKREYDEFAAKVQRDIASVAAERAVHRASQKWENEAAGRARVAQLQSEFPDVYGNPRARQLADGYYRMQIAKGRKDSKELHDEAMNVARTELGIGQPGQQPSRSSQSRYRGMPRGGQARGDGGAPARIVMTKELRAIANAAYSHIPDESKRFETWANSEAGREYAKEQAKRG